MTDEDIVRAVRRIATMESSRDVLADRVIELRTATTAKEAAEHDRCSNAMADADTRILLNSTQVLGRLGMTAAAMACIHDAQEEGTLPHPLTPHGRPARASGCL